ncbi:MULTISPECIES: hypothetical protein [unclassified Streptomyces]|uniref:hypothetical protein n=1 Tax=unclassified Streptomyces TaxID=2593676 RepID=UPI0037100B03
MTNDVDTLGTALHATTDDMLKERPDLAPWRPPVGIMPRLSDAGLVTPATMQAILGYTSVARWLRHPRRRCPPGERPCRVAHRDRIQRPFPQGLFEAGVQPARQERHARGAGHGRVAAQQQLSADTGLGEYGRPRGQPPARRVAGP